LYSGITLKDGAIEQSNFHDYRTLRLNETPAIEVYIVEGADIPGGLGEVGTAIAAPALGNAIFAATGTRFATCRSVAHLWRSVVRNEENRARRGP